MSHQNTNIGMSMHHEAREDQDVDFSAKMMVKIYLELQQMDDLSKTSRGHL